MGKLLVYVLFLHFVADFLLQSRDMGKNKSTSFKILLHHLLIQFVVIGMGLTPFLGERGSFIALVNAVIHGVIDWNIWRGYKAIVMYRMKKGYIPTAVSEFKYWDDHWFYATIGLDQFLHCATLISVISLIP